MPRVAADGTANRFRIVRLKEKLGTRDMASGEIRLEGAEAHLVGSSAAPDILSRSSMKKREPFERGAQRPQLLGEGPMTKRSAPPAFRSAWRSSGLSRGAPSSVTDCT